MANEGRQEVLRTLRSIARASGRVSIVIIILLMLVDSERNLLIAHCLHFTRKNNVRSAKDVQLVLVRGDGVQGARQEIFYLYHFSLLSLQSLLLLGKRVQGFHDVFVLCHKEWGFFGLPQASFLIVYSRAMETRIETFGKVFSYPIPPARPSQRGRQSPTHPQAIGPRTHRRVRVRVPARRQVQPRTC